MASARSADVDGIRFRVRPRADGDPQDVRDRSDRVDRPAYARSHRPGGLRSSSTSTRTASSSSMRPEAGVRRSFVLTSPSRSTRSTGELLGRLPWVGAAGTPEADEVVARLFDDFGIQAIQGGRL